MTKKSIRERWDWISSREACEMKMFCLPHSRKLPSLNPSGIKGLFYVGFTCSTHVCVRFSPHISVDIHNPNTCIFRLMTDCKISSWCESKCVCICVLWCIWMDEWMDGWLKAFKCFNSLWLFGSVSDFLSWSLLMWTAPCVTVIRVLFWSASEAVSVRRMLRREPDSIL